MKIGIWNYHEILHKDKIMLTNTTKCLGEHSLLPFYNIYLNSKKFHIDIEILDKNKNIDYYDLFIFINFPKLKKKIVKEAIYSNKPKFLMMYECEMIHPENYNKNNLKLFDRCFTWDDDLVDNIKYFKINCPSYDFPLEKAKKIDFEKKTKLSSMIASNKISYHKNDLYKERLKIIKWFDKNYKDDFDLFGYNWELVQFKNRYINKINYLLKILRNNFYVYKGEIDFKKKIMPKYKFSFCLENASNYKGYITEKIFHCFFYNTVPIYSGPENIENHIPEECYINYNNFKSLDELHKFMQNIRKNDYNKYLYSADDFLNNSVKSTFSIEYYCNVVMKEILHFKNLLISK